MKLQCLRCGGHDLYEIDQVCFEASDSINGVVSFALFAHYGPTGEMDWFGDKQRRVAVDAGARVCGDCGHAELFAKDRALLKQLADKHVPGIRRDPADV